MSAIIGRLLLAVGVGVVFAVVTRVMENRREQLLNERRSGRRRPTNPDAEYRGRSGWADGDNQNDNENTRRRPVNTSHNKGEVEVFHDAQEDSIQHEECTVQAKCPICLDSFQILKRKGIPMYTTPCGHVFCYDCIRKAIRTNGKCPVCCEDSQLGRCHKIYL